MLHADRNEKTKVLEVRASGNAITLINELSQLTWSIFSEMFGPQADKALDEWPTLIRKAVKNRTVINGAVLDQIINANINNDSATSEAQE